MALSRDDRTEAPTPRRRQEARGRGQVARSHDLTAAMLLLAGFVSIRLLGPPLWHSLLLILESALSSDSAHDQDDLYPFVLSAALELSKRLAPIVLIGLAVVLATLLGQVGWLFTWEPLTPSLSKINPLAGLQRLFSIRSTVSALASVVKLVVVAAVAYVTLSHSAAGIISSQMLDLFDLFMLAASLTFRLGLNLSIALVILALLDYVWQRFRHEQDLRMTKEEVKDEMRSMEGDPQIKRRRRQIQLQMAMHRLRKDVPKADVVVTNPTHLAVAIQYDPDTMMAPKVVAKGADYIALRIRQMATELGIPIVERKPLARALYDSVEVGQYVPEKFYRAIAEILAYVYELTGRSESARRRAAAVA